MSLCRYVVALLHHIAPLCAHPPNLVVGFGVKLVMTCDAYDDDAYDEDNRMTILTTCFLQWQKRVAVGFLPNVLCRLADAEVVGDHVHV